MGASDAALRAVAIACFVAVAISSLDAEAAPSARLVYIREPEAASCPDESAVRAAVAARLGYDPFFAYAPATMFAAIRREQGTYKVSIRLVDENEIVRGARDLVHAGEPCSELVDVMALSMSIAIDPLSLAPRPKPATAPEPAAPAAPPPATAPAVDAPPRDPERPAEPTPRAPDSLHLDVGLGPAASVGSAPAPAIGALLGGYLHLGHAGFLVEGRADWPASRAIDRGTVRTELVAGTLGACYELGAWFGCAIGSMGRLEASSEGISTPRTEAALFGAAGARTGVELPMTKGLYFRGQIDGLAVLTAHGLTIDGRDVSTLSSVAATASALLAVRFF